MANETEGCHDQIANEVMLLKLKSGKPADIKKALDNIKTHYVRHPSKVEYLVKNSTLELIFTFLEKPEFYELCLGILADCCNHKFAVIRLEKLNIIEKFIDILESCKPELAKIQNVACRAIANIAKNTKQCCAAVVEKATSHIVKFLNSTEDKEYKCTALRALLYLCENLKSQQFIANENGIDAIVKCLKSGDRKLIDGSIKVIRSFILNIDSRTSEQLIECFKTLGELRFRPDVGVAALRLLSTVSCTQSCQPYLIKAGVHEAFTSVLVESKCYKSRNYAALALSECLAFSHSWSKSEFRDCLKALLCFLSTIFTDIPHINCNVLCTVLGLLHSSCYYEANVELYLSLNLFEVLIGILKDFKKHFSVLRPDMLDLKFTNHPRCAAVPQSEYTYPCVDDDECRCKKRIGDSEKAQNSEECLTEMTSIPGPSKKQKYPLMSDAPSSQCALNSIRDVSICNTKHSCCAKHHLIGIDQFPYTEKSPAKKAKMDETYTNFQGFCLLITKGFSSRNRLDCFILTLMLQLSQVAPKKVFQKLSQPKYFSVLLDYLHWIVYPCRSARTLLINMVKDLNVFEKLIHVGFVSEIFKIIECEQKDQFWCKIRISTVWCVILTEVQGIIRLTNYGFQILCCALEKSQEVQFNALLVISKLSFDESMRLDFLYKSKIVDVFFQLLQNDSEDFCNQVAELMICFYTGLAPTDYLRNNTDNESTSNAAIDMCFYENSERDVNFSVQGKVISASRDIICKNSEYFNSLLNGPFCEKSKEIITIQDISPEYLTILFHLLHGCHNRKFTCGHFSMTYTSALDLLAQCDKFLLTDAKEYIENYLVDHITVNNAPEVYVSAFLHNSKVLRKKSLRLLFHKKTPPGHIINMRSCLNVYPNGIRTMLNDLKDIFNNKKQIIYDYKKMEFDAFLENACSIL